MTPPIRPEPSRDLYAEYLAEQKAKGKAPLLGVDALRTAGQGASFGFADEITAAARAALPESRGLEDLIAERAPKSFGDRYREYVAEERAGISRYRQDHPVAALGAEMAGGLATGGAATKALGMAARGLNLARSAEAVQAARAALSLPRQMGRAAAAGAAGGALGGLGAGEGDITERLPSAATGAAFGFGIGGLAPMIPAAGGKVLDWLGARPSPQTVAVAQQAAAARAAAPPAGTPRLQNRPGAVDLSTVRVDSREDQGVAHLLRSITDAGKSVDDLRAEVQAAHAAGKPFTVMDAGGANAVAVAKGARSVPGLAKEQLPKALYGRAEGAGPRIVDDALAESGLGARTDVRAATNEIVRQRADDAGRMYGALRDVPVDDPRLVAFFGNKRFRNAYERAQRIRENEILANPDAGLEPLPGLDDIADPATGTMAGPIPLGVLDQMKRGMDDLLFVARRAPKDVEGGLGNEEMKGLKDAYRRYMGILDEVVPEYKAARQTYASHTALKNALAEGRELFSPASKLEDVQEALESMSQHEREMFTRGALEDFAELIESKSQNADYSRFLSDVTATKKKLRLLFPDDASFGRFQKLLGLEGRMAQVKNQALGGSDTAEKLYAIHELSGGGVFGDAVERAASGGLFAGAASLAKAGQRSMRERSAKQMADALAPHLVAGSEGGPAGLASANATLDALEEARRIVEARLSRRTAAGRAAGATAGLEFGTKRQP